MRVVHPPGNIDAAIPDITVAMAINLSYCTLVRNASESSSERSVYNPFYVFSLDKKKMLYREEEGFMEIKDAPQNKDISMVLV